MAMRIRKLRASDLPAVVAIERGITGSRRVSSLSRHLRGMLTTGDGVGLVAEVDGRLAGFLAGDVRPWEFGEETAVAWIKVVGVDPRHQGKGLGRLLGQRFLALVKARGIRKVKTLVEWDAGDIVAYFQSLGFDRGDAIVLEKDL